MSVINTSPYPDTNRVPGTTAIVNASQANSGQAQQRTLIIGQMLAAGGYVPGVPVISTGLGDCQAGAGAGSILTNMLQRYRRTDTFGEVWLLPVADNPAGAAATGSVAITGPATAAGTLNLYIGAQLVAVGVSAGDPAATIATNAVAACALVPSLAVTAVAVAGTLNLTARHKGLLGNDIDLRVNYLGQLGGETTPAGVAVAFTPMAGGTLNPVVATALANVSGDQTFDFIVTAYTDPASLAAITAFLDDVSGRWSWQQQLFGGAFAAYRGTLSALATFGATENDRHLQIMSFFDSPRTSWEWAADYAAAAANSLRANPAQPLNDLALTVEAPPLQSRFDLSERNTLLFDGLSTFNVDEANVVHIERSITTYQTNAAGAPDTSFLNTERMYSIQFICRDLRTFLQSTFARMILVADGTKIPGGSIMTTSQLILQAAIARYQTYCNAGLAQNFAQFQAQAQAQNAGNGLVKLLLPVDPSDQLENMVALIQLQAA